MTQQHAARSTPRERTSGAMRAALALAVHGPVPDPNPRVGCVLLDPTAPSSAEVPRRRRARRTPRSLP